VQGIGVVEVAVVEPGVNVVGADVEVVVLRQPPEGGVFQTTEPPSSKPAIQTHSPSQGDGGSVVLAEGVVLDVDSSELSSAIGSLDQSPFLF
jgi:hypothetical protein